MICFSDLPPFHAPREVAAATSTTAAAAAGHHTEPNITTPLLTAPHHLPRHHATPDDTTPPATAPHSNASLALAGAKHSPSDAPHRHDRYRIPYSSRALPTEALSLQIDVRSTTTVDLEHNTVLPCSTSQDERFPIDASLGVIALALPVVEKIRWENRPTEVSSCELPLCPEM